MSYKREEVTDVQATRNKDYAVLIGDVAASRKFADQTTLFSSLREHFDWVNDHVVAEQALQFTIGDEFQAAYRDVGAAFRASILLRLRFKERPLQVSVREQDVRMGLAYGEISVLDEEVLPYGQSGDAWWSARRAIEQTEQPKRQHGLPYAMQTRFHAADPLLTATANAFLMALDQVFYKMDRKDIAITLGILTGRKQQDIAVDLDIKQPVVSRRSKSNGAYTIENILAEFNQVSDT